MLMFVFVLPCIVKQDFFFQYDTSGHMCTWNFNGHIDASGFNYIQVFYYLHFTICICFFVFTCFLMYFVFRIQGYIFALLYVKSWESFGSFVGTGLGLLGISTDSTPDIYHKIYNILVGDRSQNRL